MEKRKKDDQFTIVFWNGITDEIRLMKDTWPVFFKEQDRGVYRKLKVTCVFDGNWMSMFEEDFGHLRHHRKKNCWVMNKELANKLIDIQKTMSNNYFLDLILKPEWFEYFPAAQLIKRHLKTETDPALTESLMDYAKLYPDNTFIQGVTDAFSKQPDQITEKMIDNSLYNLANLRNFALRGPIGED